MRMRHVLIINIQCYDLIPVCLDSAYVVMTKSVTERDKESGNKTIIK